MFTAATNEKQSKCSSVGDWINKNEYIHTMKLYIQQLKGMNCWCMLQNILSWGFPGGAVVESLPANARDMGSSPGLGGSHMPRSDWAREPQLLSLRVWSLCSTTGEAAMVRGPRTAMKSGPRLPQLERALTQKRRPNTVKKYIYIYIYIKLKMC